MVGMGACRRCVSKRLWVGSQAADWAAVRVLAGPLTGRMGGSESVARPLAVQSGDGGLLDGGPSIIEM